MTHCHQASTDVAMTLNDKPSHAVSRLSTAGSEFSPVSIKYIFMGPGPVDDFEVDGCGSSSAFFFWTLQLWSHFRCSWSHLLEPPVAFKVNYRSRTSQSDLPSHTQSIPIHYERHSQFLGNKSPMMST